MLVNDYMTIDVTTITKETPIFDAVDIMKDKNIHRLPVVENGKLIGLITEGTIQEAMPSKATSLSVHEVNYLLNKTKVSDIMIKDVQTLPKDSLIEDAIYVMRKNNIGVLPVIDQNGYMEGIITSNDIFDAFLSISGYQEAGTRVAVSIPNDHEGVLADLAKLFAEFKMNIVQIVVYRQRKEPIIMIQTTHQNSDEVRQLLTDHNYNVIICMFTKRGV